MRDGAIQLDTINEGCNIARKISVTRAEFQTPADRHTPGQIFTENPMPIKREIRADYFEKQYLILARVKIIRRANSTVTPIEK